MDTSEAELLEQARQGDRTAFRALYDRTSGFVYNTARRVVGNDEDAEEVTQDVFVSAHRHLDRFRGESSIKTWLYRIAVNLALNKLKSRSGKQQEVPYEEYMDTPQETAPDKALLEQDADQRVQQLLDRLPADFRACLVLREIEGLSYDKIAETLKVNVNTVRTRLLRGRRQLAGIIQQQRSL